MKRRVFLKTMAAAATWPLLAEAQQPETPVIGFLSSGSSTGRQDQVEAFLKGLKETGRKVGENAALNIAGLTIETTNFNRSH
jgi:hypothetical protein